MWKSLISVLVLCVGCQLGRNTSQLTSPKPHTILVKGSLIGTRDTTDLLTGVRVVFTRRLPNGTHEVVIDSQGTGHYQVRLTTGVTYIGAMRWRNCDIEAQVVPIPIEKPSFVMVKNFYMSYPDSTHYGGCTAEWEKARYHK
ncbi:MAG TPA: hypothetical protein VF629_13880 [Hymenobacter sp.]|jgi:hypothetical protein